MRSRLASLSKQQLGISYLLAFGLLNGCVGVFVKLVQGLGAQQLVFLRAIIASLFVLAFVLLTGKIKELKLRHHILTAAVGIAQGFSIWFYFIAILQTSVANAVFLGYSAPIFSAFFAWLFLKEKILNVTLVGIFFAILGILFIVNPTTISLSSHYMIGNLFALASGVLYAAMAVIAKPLTEKVSGYYVVFWQYAIISVLFFFISGGANFDLVTHNLWQLLAIGIVSTGIAFVLFMKGVALVKAQQVFIISAVEPLVGSILAFLVLREQPPFTTIIGALLILMGVYVVGRSKTAQ